VGKIFWVDCETTGLDSVNHAIIQIAGLIEINERVEETVNLFMRPLLGNEKFHYKENPGIDDEINNEALKVNGRSREEIFDFQHPRVAFESLFSTLDRYINKDDPHSRFICGGKNVGFDMGFMWEGFSKTGFDNFSDYFLDVSRELECLIADMIAEKNLKLENYSLSTVCEYYNVEINNHEAMSDIIATRELFYILRNELGIKPAFCESPRVTQISKNNYLNYFEIPSQIP
jgi:DNA polymerase III subunit epsilon